MAKNSRNLLIEVSRGAVGKQVVFKKVNGKTILTKYPDMSGVTYNDTQIRYQNLFAKAVKFARGILADPDLRTEYQRKIHDNKKFRGTSVYHYALTEYINKHSGRISQQAVEKKLLCKEI